MSTNPAITASETYVNNKVGERYAKPAGGIPLNDLSN